VAKREKPQSRRTVSAAPVNVSTLSVGVIDSTNIHAIEVTGRDISVTSLLLS
jgi:hypothetical protein